MHTRHAALALALSLIFSTTAPAQVRRTPPPPPGPPAAPRRVPAPEEVLGFRPGDDRKLASWADIVAYFKQLAAASDRVRVDELGQTTLGRPFVLATISAPENLARLDEFRAIQQQLADPRLLGPHADRKAGQLVARGKTVVLITCGIHSTEVGSTLSSLLIAHRLAAAADPETRAILQQTIVLLVPSLNPDGVDIVQQWYARTLGTPYEGTTPPELYHKYTGHDNNRDWYAFTQVETQLTVDKIHNVWHPQIVHDIHQQGEFGARLFLPPYLPPVEPNVPPQIVAGYTELGHYMATALRAAGFKGITTDSTYDAWTPARAYSHYHGGVRILSETASARLATPLTVKFADLRARDGYDPQHEAANFGPLWPGGAWHLRDITDYMTAAAFTLLRHAAAQRTAWLQRSYAIGRAAVRPRKAGELYAYIIPPAEHAGALLDILARGGVELDRPGRFTVNGRTYPQGTTVVRMAQPYAGFAKALLEPQHYPDLRTASGHPIAPYDVTAHTLSLLMGVPVVPVTTPFILPLSRGEREHGWNGGCGGGVPARRAVYKSHVPALDEGWTRWVLDHDSNCLFYQSLTDAALRAGHLRAQFDTIIIPDQAPQTILQGYRAGTMPPELTGGVGAAGVQALREFVAQGGTLVALNEASDFAIEALQLPVRDITAGLPHTEYYAPGSILRTEIDTTHPVAKGMPRASIAWVEDSPVFEFDRRDAERVHVIARYPFDHDPLLSGWLLGGRKLWGKAALVEVTVGRGRVYLFGFRPQYRGQALATYPLFFNAIKTGAQ